MSDGHLTTPRVRRWLAHSREARILHLFADVCNLVNEEGQVVSLVSRRIGAGPFALVLAERRAWPAGSSATVKIDRRAERLSVGPLLVAYGAARCWQPKPAWRRLRTPAGTERPAPAELPPAIDELLQHLLDGICQGERTLVRTAAARLAGRGQGLTPTGDDVLVGVLYALWVWQPERDWMRLIAESAAPHTTTLSAAFLRAAAAGEATRPWHRLVTGDPGAVADIVATGHSSGAETWAGFRAAVAKFSAVAVRPAPVLGRVSLAGRGGE